MWIIKTSNLCKMLRNLLLWIKNMQCKTRLKFKEQQEMTLRYSVKESVSRSWTGSIERTVLKNRFASTSRTSQSGALEARDPHPWAWRCVRVLMKTGESRHTREKRICAPSERILTDCVSIRRYRRQSAELLHAVFVYFYRMVSWADEKHKLLLIARI